MTRDELSPEWREKYDALVNEWSAKLEKLPEPKRKGLNLLLHEAEDSRPRRELEKEYVPRLKALFAEAKKAMKVSGEEGK
ncbi:MAG: hypothetical protein HFI15_16115 [Lachnospiraceae bacterium]|jgi:hypothetical protein|nr:hypothetical protein [Lachnospiraceae bacterium]